MRTDCVLVFLTFSAFAGSVTARILPWEPPVLPGTRDKFEKCNSETYPVLYTFKDAVLNTERYQTKQPQKQLNKVKDDFEVKDKKMVEEAGEEGRLVNKVCVTEAQQQHLKNLKIASDKSMNCVKNAAETAKNIIDNAIKTYLKISSEGFADTQAKEEEWATIKCMKNDACVAVMAVLIQFRIQETQTESKKVIETSKLAYSNQVTTGKKCLETLKKKMAELQKKHDADVEKCIESHWSWDWIL